ncbi:hypothetical protein J0895_19310 [Phormidium pseudopriestleyi FRX01]|uniref:Uncharacterized protein n=1 Tax=Phormidium pseudopriestleyi FRX01 TaxID=1759528 RepID=A0ABS3FWF3_9CYAN|nr:hypothetical protein [Phormidium pseudopriestleyi]MBO0351182.1 hypothetical protein [Phormidium pseudopriestleyi FRX01]
MSNLGKNSTNQSDFARHKLPTRIFADNQDLDLIEWLEKSRLDLVQKAKEQEEESHKETGSTDLIENIKQKVKKIFQEWVDQWVIADIQKVSDWLSSHFLAQADQLHGQVFVSEELSKDSQITATVLSGATWINAITNWPILYYAFNNWGTIIALSSTLVLDFLILNWTNNTGTAAASFKRGRFWWSVAGIVAFFFVSMLQSIVAGIGAELINNQDELSNIKAGEIIDEYFQQLAANLQVKKDEYQPDRSKCTQDVDRLEDKELEYNSPERRSVYERAYGQYDERHKDWSKAKGQIPNCPKADLGEIKVNQDQEQLNQSKNQRQELGNVMYLKERLPYRYEQTFTPNGQINSGVVAVQMAVNNFGQKFANWEFDKLGFSIFFLSLSMITSLGALFMTAAYAIKYNTLMSRNPRVEQAITLWLHEIWCSYRERERVNLDNSNTNNASNSTGKDYPMQPYHGFLLSLFIQEFQETGRSNYSVLQQIAQGAQEHPDYVLKLIQYRKLVTEVENSYDIFNEMSIKIIEKLNDLLNEIYAPNQTCSFTTLSKKFESKVQKDFTNLSSALHSLIIAHNNSVKKPFFMDLIGSKFAANWAVNNDNCSDLIAKIDKIWEELNQECNLTFILEELKFANNVGSPQKRDEHSSQAISRCRKVKQQLHELSGYCALLAIRTIDNIQDKIDEARLMPFDSSISLPPS